MNPTAVIALYIDGVYWPGDRSLGDASVWQMMGHQWHSRHKNFHEVEIMFHDTIHNYEANFHGTNTIFPFAHSWLNCPGVFLFGTCEYWNTIQCICEYPQNVKQPWRPYLFDEHFVRYAQIVYIACMIVKYDVAVPLIYRSRYRDRTVPQESSTNLKSCGLSKSLRLETSGLSLNLTQVIL